VDLFVHSSFSNTFGDAVPLVVVTVSILDEARASTVRIDILPTVGLISDIFSFLGIKWRESVTHKSMDFLVHASLGNSFGHHHKWDGVTKGVAERGMDEEVHGFVSDALPPFDAKARASVAYKPNGWANVYPENASSFQQRRHHSHHRDVAERGMDPDVNGFVEDAIPPL
jgi:hypothetical protein